MWLTIFFLGPPSFPDVLLISRRSFIVVILYSTVPVLNKRPRALHGDGVWIV